MSAEGLNTVPAANEAQHAVRGRMLRAEVDGEVAEVLGHHFAFSSPGSGT